MTTAHTSLADMLADGRADRCGPGRDRRGAGEAPRAQEILAD